MAGAKRGLGDVTGEESEEELLDSPSSSEKEKMASSEEDEVKGEGGRPEEPRLKVEKVPASLWRDVNLVTVSGGQGPASH